MKSSVQKEIQRKGTELASSSGSAANYRDNMSSYIDSMYNADGDATPYSRYITEYGQEYVQSTYTTLAKKEAEAARKALITSEKIRLAENELSIKKANSSWRQTPMKSACLWDQAGYWI